MKTFDDYIRDGNDAKALRLLAEEMYRSGKCGQTRYELLKRDTDVWRVNNDCT